MPKTAKVKPAVIKKGWIWIVTGAVVAAAVIWFGAGHTHAQPPNRSKAGRGGAGSMATPVAVGTVTLGDMPVFYDGLGNVIAYYTTIIHTRVDGQLMSVRYREGQYVREGDLLAQIDPRPFEVQLEQAEGQLARDEALLANARIDLARYRALAAQNAIPKQQLDTQIATVGQYEGNVKTDQGAVDNAKLQLTYCRVTAPISGRIGLRLVDPGNIVHASDANGLLVITQLQPITAIFTLGEDAVTSVAQRLRRGAVLRVDAYNRDKSQKLATGRLLSLDNQIDPTTGTARLKAVFENRQSTLFPNQFINARLLLETKHNQLVIPAVAIQRGSQGTFVYVVQPDNTVQVRPVTVDITEGAVASVRGGLNAGDRVVVDGADRLQPGGKVAIRPAATSTPNTNSAGQPAAGPAGGYPE